MRLYKAIISDFSAHRINSNLRRGNNPIQGTSHPRLRLYLKVEINEGRAF